MPQGTTTLEGPAASRQGRNGIRDGKAEPEEASFGGQRQHPKMTTSAVGERKAVTAATAWGRSAGTKGINDGSGLGSSVDNHQ